MGAASRSPCAPSLSVGPRSPSPTLGRRATHVGDERDDYDQTMGTGRASPSRLKRDLPAVARSRVRRLQRSDRTRQVVGAERLHDPEPGVRPARGRELPDRDAAPRGRSLPSDRASSARSTRPFASASPSPGKSPIPTTSRRTLTLSFRDLGESTEVALTQGPFKTEDRRALHRDGWTDSLDKLERLLADQTA